MTFPMTHNQIAWVLQIVCAAAQAVPFFMHWDSQTLNGWHMMLAAVQVAIGGAQARMDPQTGNLPPSSKSNL